MTTRLIAFLLLFNVAFSQNPLPLIPQPQYVKLESGHFELNKQTVIQADERMFEAQYLKQAIKQQTGLDLKILPVAANVPKISLSFDLDAVAASGQKEPYELAVTNKEIAIKAEYNQGFFYGIQTLLQMIPFEKRDKFQLPCLQIYDGPKYVWRGMHLDCARHFFPVEFVKKYIDYLAMYKFNTFHWHLTDDQGWRIEIKKYPKLTEVGAWRNGSMVGHYSEQKFDDKRYGGFYTQEEIKELVAYAAQRHITIVPEIEMPGHALAALASYPEYSCTGGPFEVGKIWGVLDDVFCPKEETFTFLQNILTEVIALFPSEYIHIGGDESPKTRWKACPHCQALIKEKGLKDEHELQSYFIQRIEKFVNSKGRKIIGWDEILEGGLAPNAAVMSWRGTEGGIAAAKQKHFVVMTPGSHCYFDYYQGDPKNEPLAIGGYIPLEKVYSFNPTPKELNSEEAKYILGGQANVWTEYMEDASKVEYMIFPRIMALSEAVWGKANPADYSGFLNRMIQQFAVLDKKGIHYSKAIFEIKSKVIPSGNGIAFDLHSAKNSKNIRYTTDNKTPTWNSIPYATPIVITNEIQKIKAAYFENKKQQSNVTEQYFTLNKAIGKKVTLLNPPHENYAGDGVFTLFDGVSADRSKPVGKEWLGFSGKDLNVVIDLGKEETLGEVYISVLESKGSWIYYPKQIEVLFSDDGKDFNSIAKFTTDEIKESNGLLDISFHTQGARFVKVIATNAGKIAEGNPGAGSDAWLFVDEIRVN